MYATLTYFLEYHVTIRLEDICLEEGEMDHIRKADLGFYIYLGKKLQDVVVLNPNGGLSNPVKIPLAATISEEKIVILAKTLGAEEILVGSLSIP